MSTIAVEDNIEQSASSEQSDLKSKPKIKGRKRKRESSESSSDESVLPDNALEVEKNLHASALKNNLDEGSVKKILKKVVTNDHVLALVKLREEEEESSKVDEVDVRPKITRAKAKELGSPWNLELTPIKHIPVKTRPEVKALIAQELQEDEDDDEYEPTNDDIPSDDDQTLESCSDVDSQPRTPATPGGPSPRVLKDGPFKVPQKPYMTPVRRKLQLEEEEATIALRTRSKLSLSETPIEHIESSFVPPDELPLPAVDDLWSQFLSECLNPVQSLRHEDDDEADPEYNAAADPDAHDEEEEGLDGSILRISKKELSDLVTELFNVMPEAATNEDIAETLANNVNGTNVVTNQWVGKKKMISDETQNSNNNASTSEIDDQEVRTYTDLSNSIVTRSSSNKDCVTNTTHSTGTRSSAEEQEVRTYTDISKSIVAPPCINIQDIRSNANTDNVGEPNGNSDGPNLRIHQDVGKSNDDVTNASNKAIAKNAAEVDAAHKSSQVISIVQEQEADVDSEQASTVAPPPLLKKLFKGQQTTVVHVEACKILPKQIAILQQQLRQHIQLSACNFMQLYVHPIHWSYAPTFKDFVVTLSNMGDEKPNSVVNVCNLKPAVELIRSWEESVSQDNPQNAEMVEFLQKEADRSRRRNRSNKRYLGEFHPTFLRTVATAGAVFLYPHLLPAMPFRYEAAKRKFGYIPYEDELVVLGLDQFWSYIEANPDIYKRATSLNIKHQPRFRWGLRAVVDLLIKHMLPWQSLPNLVSHIQNTRKIRGSALQKFFDKREVTPVVHEILPYDPKLTLYEQPEDEIPRIWLRYLSKTHKRFRDYLYRHRHDSFVSVDKPEGTRIPTDKEVENDPDKPPLPKHFTQQFTQPKYDLLDEEEKKSESASVQNQSANVNVYKVVQVEDGSYLLPIETISMDTTTPPEVTTELVGNDLPETATVIVVDQTQDKHCACCMLLKKIVTFRQLLITDFVKPKPHRVCPCKKQKYPTISRKLRLLVNSYRKMSDVIWDDVANTLNADGDGDGDKSDDIENDDAVRNSSDDLAYVGLYQMRLAIKSTMIRNPYMKSSIFRIFSNFQLATGDPIQLAHEFCALCDIDLIEFYKEFIGFLTAEQAVKLDAFKDYFIHNCLKDLLNKIEEKVKNKEHKCAILRSLNAFKKQPTIRSCEMCAMLLDKMYGYPELAQYTFNLFPHKGILESCIIEKPVLRKKKTRKKKSTESTLIKTVPKYKFSRNTALMNLIPIAPKQTIVNETTPQPPIEITPKETTKNSVEQMPTQILLQKTTTSYSTPRKLRPRIQKQKQCKDCTPEKKKRIVTQKPMSTTDSTSQTPISSKPMPINESTPQKLITITPQPVSTKVSTPKKRIPVVLNLMLANESTPPNFTPITPKPISISESTAPSLIPTTPRTMSIPTSKPISLTESIQETLITPMLTSKSTPQKMLLNSPIPVSPKPISRNNSTPYKLTIVPKPTQTPVQISPKQTTGNECIPQIVLRIAPNLTTTPIHTSPMQTAGNQCTPQKGPEPTQTPIQISPKQTTGNQCIPQTLVQVEPKPTQTPIQISPKQTTGNQCTPQKGPEPTQTPIQISPKQTTGNQCIPQTLVQIEPKPTQTPIQISPKQMTGNQCTPQTLVRLAPKPTQTSIQISPKLMTGNECTPQTLVRIAPKPTQFSVQISPKLTTGNECTPRTLVQIVPKPIITQKIALPVESAISTSRAEDTPVSKTVGTLLTRSTMKKLSNVLQASPNRSLLKNSLLSADTAINSSQSSQNEIKLTRQELQPKKFCVPKNILKMAMLHNLAQKNLSMDNEVVDLTGPEDTPTIQQSNDSPGSFIVKLNTISNNIVSSSDETNKENTLNLVIIPKTESIESDQPDLQNAPVPMDCDDGSLKSPEPSVKSVATNAEIPDATVINEQSTPAPVDNVLNDIKDSSGPTKTQIVKKGRVTKRKPTRLRKRKIVKKKLPKQVADRSPTPETTNDQQESTRERLTRLLHPASDSEQIVDYQIPLPILYKAEPCSHDSDLEDGDRLSMATDEAMTQAASDTETEFFHFVKSENYSGDEMEPQRHVDYSNERIVFLSEEDIKTDTPEWTREEDKYILQILKDQLVSPTNLEGKSILDLLEDQAVVRNLTESLYSKDVKEIKTRMLYLFQMLVTNEN